MPFASLSSACTAKSFRPCICLGSRSCVGHLALLGTTLLYKQVQKAPGMVAGHQTTEGLKLKFTEWELGPQM